MTTKLLLGRSATLGLAVTLALGAALGLPWARPAYAANCDESRQVFGGNYTLGAGQVLDRNLVVFGGDADIEADARIECSVVVLGGSVDIAGTVDGDLVVFGGGTHLRSTAVIGGDLATVGGGTTRDAGAEVRGSESQGLTGDWGVGLPIPALRRMPVASAVFNLYSSLFQTLLTVLGISLLALLVTLFWPDQTSRVSAAITSAPVAAGGLGLLTVVAVPVLILAVAITICGIPVALVAALALAAAMVFGWIALGQLIGARLTTALKLETLSAAVSAALGTLVLSLALSAVGWIPCIGWIPGFLLAAVGLGAVVLTRFGTRPYLPAPASRPLPPPPPAPAELADQ